MSVPGSPVNSQFSPIGLPPGVPVPPPPGSGYLITYAGAPGLYFGQGGKQVTNPRDAASWMDRATAEATAAAWGEGWSAQLPPAHPALSPALAYLKQLRQFVVWKSVPDPGRPKAKKMPVDYRTRQVGVNPHEPQYWTDYDSAAIAAAAWGSEYSVGFVLTREARVAVIDYDNALLPDGTWHATVRAIHSRVPGAAIEISHSGAGAHNWCVYQGELPAQDITTVNVGGLKVELFLAKKFIALGNQETARGDAGTDYTAALQQIVAEFFPPGVAAGWGVAGDWSEGHGLGWELPDDIELIRTALSFKPSPEAAFSNGVSFADLWTRNTAKLRERFPSETAEFGESEADLALAGWLAWLTGNDCPRIEGLMRKSFLSRDKWDSHPTYLCEFTIPKALRQDGEFWDPKYKEKKQQEEERRRKQIEEATRIGEGSQEHLPAEVITLEEMLTRYLYIEDGDRVQDLKHPRLVVPFDQFVKSHRSSKTVLEVKGELNRDGSQKTKSHESARLWEHGARSQIKTVTFRPGHLARTVDPDGNPASNTWRPIGRVPLAPGTGDASLFLNHVRWLFGADAERFLDWLAHIEQHPGELPHTSWLHVSLTQGKGRNWLANVLCRVWQGHVANNFNLTRMLKTGFDGRLSKKLLVIVDEIHEGGSNARWDSSETLKSIITAEQRELNPKYGFPLVEWNVARWLMFSNHVSAIPLDNQDRRFEVVKHEGARMPNGYYEQLWVAVKDPSFIAGVAQHLLTRDIRHFNLGDHAVVTEAKREMVAASRSEADEIIADIVATHPADVITNKALAGLLNNQAFGGGILSAHQKHALDRAGIQSYGKPIWLVGKPARVRILRNHSIWKDALPQQIQAELTKGSGAPPVITEPYARN